MCSPGSKWADPCHLGTHGRWPWNHQQLWSSQQEQDFNFPFWKWGEDGGRGRLHPLLKIHKQLMAAGPGDFFLQWCSWPQAGHTPASDSWAVLLQATARTSLVLQTRPVWNPSFSSVVDALSRVNRHVFTSQEEVHINPSFLASSSWPQLLHSLVLLCLIVHDSKIPGSPSQLLRSTVEHIPGNSQSHKHTFHKKGKE